MQFSPLGHLVQACILAIPNHHNAEIYNHIVMPNHVHLLIGLHGGCNLSTVVGSFKSSVTRQARQTAMIDAEQPIWQARYHDHIVRSEDDFHRINAYIASNPETWSVDRLFSSSE
jgi:putative transposase